MPASPGGGPGFVRAAAGKMPASPGGGPGFVRAVAGKMPASPGGGPGFVRAVAGKMPASPGETKCNAALLWQCAVIRSSIIGTTGQPDIRPSDDGRDKARRLRPDGSGLEWTAWTTWTWDYGEGWPERQVPRPFTSMLSTQVKKLAAGLYTILHVLHGQLSPER